MPGLSSIEGSHNSKRKNQPLIFSQLIIPQMKCVREASISSFSCVRCHKAGRVCSGAATSWKPTGTRGASKQPLSRKIVTGATDFHDRISSLAASEILPSIYSTSPTSHVEKEYQSQNLDGNVGLNREPDVDSTAIDDYISNEDSIQLINM